jgi:DNA-binding Lrp family transcriptional regulator
LLGWAWCGKQQLDNLWTHVTLTTKGCQEDDQLFKAVTQVFIPLTDTDEEGFTARMTKRMEGKNQYQEGHLFVAAVRVLEHHHGAPPTLEQIAEMLKFSSEQTGWICRRLQEAGIVRVVEGAFGDRWGIEDHIKLEALPRDTEPSQLDEALKQFKAEKNKIAQKVESIKEQQAKKQKDLFSEIEKKLKKDLNKHKT